MARLGFIFVLLALLIPIAGIAQQSLEILIVEVKGAKANTGQVQLSLFSNEENYLNEPIQSEEKLVDEAGQVVFEITGLQSGKFAISVIYDEDSDGKLDTGFLGIPTELVGFSNNEKGLFGPPSFNKTSFYFPDQQVILIRLGKAKD